MSGGDLLALVAVVKDLSARMVQAESRIDALENPDPSDGHIKNTDSSEPSEADKVAMRERLRASTLKGIEANKTDRNRAGGPITRDGFDVA